MGKNTAITYARKSVKVKGISVEQGVSYQQVTIEEYAKKHNMNIIKKYSDIGYSGASLERPELIEILKVPKETFHWCVIPTVSLSGHRLY